MSVECILKIRYAGVTSTLAKFSLKCRIKTYIFYSISHPIQYSIGSHSMCFTLCLRIVRKKLFTAMAFTRGMVRKIHAQSHEKCILFSVATYGMQKSSSWTLQTKKPKKSNLVSCHCHWHLQTHVRYTHCICFHLCAPKLTYVTCITLGYVPLSEHILRIRVVYIRFDMAIKSLRSLFVCIV